MSKQKLNQRFDDFARGRWASLLEASRSSTEAATTAQHRRRRRHGAQTNDVEKRAAKALMMVQMGELSSARQALEGAELAPGSPATLAALRDPTRRPDQPRDPIPPALMDLVPRSFELDEVMFVKNLRSFKRGAAGGPSSMTMEHLRPLLESPRDTHLLYGACQLLAVANIPQEVKDGFRLGRMTALAKPDGGVRGIVAGDVIRRLTARTIAQQLGKAVEACTAPFQCALSTKAGCECIPHTLQALCELNPEATVISVDGISAFDLVSRRAMLEGLHSVPGGAEALPFVRMFYGQLSRYLWEDEEGTVHVIGGEQGDVLMPLLFSLGQHAALEAVQRHLRQNEKMFAYLDDIYILTTPDRVGEVYYLLQDALFLHAHIRLHSGKTQVWNKSGTRPQACDALERVARTVNPRAVVWRGSQLLAHEQGIKVLGTPMGHPAFVAAHLERTTAEHQVLLDRIPHVPDVQSAWLLLLHCASARANYLLRVVSPEQVQEFAGNHDTRLWACLCAILGIPPDMCDRMSHATATLPLVLGGLGLRSAVRTSPSAFWASWADCLHMVHQRHPAVSALLVHHLDGATDTPHLGAAVQVARALEGVHGFEVPSWPALAMGHRPPQNLDEFEIDAIRGGGGNMKLLPEWNVTSVRGPFSLALLTGRELF